MREDLVYWVTLHSVDSVGPATYDKLLDRFGDPQTVLFSATVGEIAELPRVRHEVAEEIVRAKEKLEAVGALIEDLVSKGVKILTPQDDGYPQLLLGMKHPPQLVYLYGEIRPDDEDAVAIVGTTRPSDEGRELAREAGQRLARKGLTIVSGYADGIDVAGHLGALDAGGRTILVLPHGLYDFKVKEGFPPLEELVQHGAVVSEFFPTEPWNVGAAMARNRLVIALCRGVFIVETRPKGGTMNTYFQAKEHGRKVFVLKYQKPPENATGNDSLIRDGAEPIRNFSDLKKMIGLPTPEDAKEEARRRHHEAQEEFHWQ